MKIRFWFFAFLFFFSACSEGDNVEEEFADWRVRNESYFNSLFSEVSERIASGDDSWHIIRKWSLEDSVDADVSDFVIVHEIVKGVGSDCPLFTDSAAVMYSGRLLPSLSYPGGYVFDKTWEGDFFPETSAARGFRISSGSLTDGFATVLQYMHLGDRWEVYIPYALAYGVEGNGSSIPGYSTLIFDMTLTAFWRDGVRQR